MSGSDVSDVDNFKSKNAFNNDKKHFDFVTKIGEESDDISAYSV